MRGQCVPDVEQLLVAPHPHGQEGDEHVSRGRRTRPPRVARADLGDEFNVWARDNGATHRHHQILVSALYKHIQPTNPGY